MKTKEEKNLNLKSIKSFKDLRKFSFLKNLRSYELKLFSRLLLERNFKEGEQIFKEGYPHAVLYLLVDGEVNIVVESENDEKIVVATIQPFSEFGEVGLFIETNRTASAISKTECKLFAISKNDFKDFVNTFPKTGVKILYSLGMLLSQNLINTNKRLKTK